MVLNTALVSLENVQDSNDVIESKGFGVVIGINRDLVYLKTALPDEEMEKINALTCGSIYLPHGYFLSKPKNYVEEKSSVETPLNVPWQRSGKPRLNEFSQNS